MTFVFIFKCKISLNHFLVTLQFPLTALCCFSIIIAQFQTKIPSMTKKTCVQPAASNQSHRRWRARLLWENLKLTQQTCLAIHDPRDQSDFFVPSDLLYNSVHLLVTAAPWAFGWFAVSSLPKSWLVFASIVFSRQVLCFQRCHQPIFNGCQGFSNLLITAT